jgi:hypothetical protein
MSRCDALKGRIYSSRFCHMTNRFGAYVVIFCGAFMPVAAL